MIECQLLQYYPQEKLLLMTVVWFPAVPVVGDDVVINLPDGEKVGGMVERRGFRLNPTVVSLFLSQEQLVSSELALANGWKVKRSSGEK